ncbi:MAG: phosphohistidine phosphatase SixA [Gammaproteobacteria bacterium]|nr:MAG: phosphohistidine phosphatase SixA [Gammaproteobacteria bacterium]
MKLYLMRHGEALSPNKDPEQGLTESGKSNIEKVARQLHNNGVTFNRVLHSKKKRARQTAEIMIDNIAPEVTATLHQHITPNDDPGLIISEINTWDEDTLITSHLPYVPNLITRLTGEDAFLSAISFETGTVVCLIKDDNSTWSIMWSTCPSEL